jgi:multidrug transporter EmrE-like cation transporter
MKWFILLIGIATNASASVLIKLAMIPPRKFPVLSDPTTALKNWPFWVGLFLYGVAFLLYSAALARLPLNVAHPILTSGAIAAVAFASYFMFREPIYWTTFAGIAFIILGVALISVRAA